MVHKNDCMCSPKCIERGMDARDQRRLRGVGRQGPGSIARGVATAGIISAVYTSGTTLPMSNETPLRNEGTRQAAGERSRRSRDVHNSTQDKDERTRGSSQNR